MRRFCEANKLSKQRIGTMTISRPSVALLRAVWVLVVTTLPSFGCHGFFLFLLSSCSERCGLFQLRKHLGTGDNCVEYCVFPFFMDPALECGGCNINAAKTPTPSPLSTADIGTYDITLQLVDIPNQDQGIFRNATKRWESIVRGDISDVSSDQLSSLGNGCVLPDTVDDLFICAAYDDIDGPGRILGSAGPRAARSNGLSTTGFMRFDAADIAYLKSQGDFQAVILHEMGHILGIGTLWEAGSKLIKCPYQGSQANAEYAALTGCSRVPTEDDGRFFRRGTYCGHWDEACMGSELMTGFLDATKNPLSRISIASLEDMGYRVDYSTADPFTRGDINPSCLCRRRTLMDMMHGETHALALRASGTQNRRRISEDAYNIALNYGLQQLAERASLDASTASNALRKEANQDSRVISVMVEDNGSIFGVVVRAED